MRKQELQVYMSGSYSFGALKIFIKCDVTMLFRSKYSGDSLNIPSILLLFSFILIALNNIKAQTLRIQE